MRHSNVKRRENARQCGLWETAFCPSANDCKRYQNYLIFLHLFTWFWAIEFCNESPTVAVELSTRAAIISTILLISASYFKITWSYNFSFRYFAVWWYGQKIFFLKRSKTWAPLVPSVVFFTESTREGSGLNCHSKKFPEIFVFNIFSAEKLEILTATLVILQLYQRQAQLMRPLNCIKEAQRLYCFRKARKFATSCLRQPEVCRKSSFSEITFQFSNANLFVEYFCLRYIFCSFMRPKWDRNKLILVLPHSICLLLSKQWLLFVSPRWWLSLWNFFQLDLKSCKSNFSARSILNASALLVNWIGIPGAVPRGPILLFFILFIFHERKKIFRSPFRIFWHELCNLQNGKKSKFKIFVLSFFSWLLYVSSNMVVFLKKNFFCRTWFFLQKFRNVWFFIQRCWLLSFFFNLKLCFLALWLKRW